MLKKVAIYVGVVTLFLGYVQAKPVVAAFDAPIVLGQWHSNLELAKATAAELGVPLLVLWGSTTCSHCSAFDAQLEKAACVEYLANRGMVMVYSKGNGSVHSWVGSGAYPLWRVTWPAGDVDYRGQYPKTYEGFRAELERQIGDYVPGQTSVKAEDARDPDSDAAATAPTLVWKELAVTENLRLATSTNYTDAADWYTLAVLKGKTYKVWFSKVSGQINDVALAAVYGDAEGTVVIGAPVNLQDGNFEFFAGAAGQVFIKVWRDTTTDDAIQYAMSYQVKPLGKLAAANYQGWFGNLDTDGVIGTVSLSVSSAGKLSGKANFPTKGPLYGGTYTLLNATYNMLSNDTAWITGTFSKAGDAVPVTLALSSASGQVVGTLGPDTNAIPVKLFRDDWAKGGAWGAAAAAFSGYYTVSFPNCCSRWPDDAPAGSGFATITLDNKGRYKVAGKLGDGTPLTQGGVLFLHPDTTLEKPVLCALIYSAPSAYSGGRFAGVVCFGDLNTNGVVDAFLGYGEKFVWSSLNPQSVPQYDDENPGFESTLSVIGGWYSKTANLSAYYSGKTLSVGDLDEPPALAYMQSVMETEDGKTVTTTSEETAEADSWQAETNLTVFVTANGAGFKVPAADLKLLEREADGKPVYNYDSAVNPNALKVSFNRATGVMSGSFKVYYDYATKIDTRSDPEKVTWKQTQVLASYAAILLLEQAEENSELVADGYYLLPDTAAYETAAGTMRKYSLKRSYPFNVLSEENE